MINLRGVSTKLNKYIFYLFQGIVPVDHSEGMFSWFPIFFPVQVRDRVMYIGTEQLQNSLNVMVL